MRRSRRGAARSAALVAAAALSLAFSRCRAPRWSGRRPTGHGTTVAAGSVGALALFLSGPQGGPADFRRRLHRHSVRARRCGRARLGQRAAVPRQPGAVGRHPRAADHLRDLRRLSSPAGLPGALAITAGIFLPAFAFALLFYDRLERVIEDERLHRFLEGVAAGVVGLIAVTALQLGWSVARSAPSLLAGAAIFAACLALLYSGNRSSTCWPSLSGPHAAGAVAFA